MQRVHPMNNEKNNQLQRVHPLSKEKVIRAIKLNLVSAIILILAFAVIFSIFIAFKRTIGEWPSELWGIIAIAVTMVYAFTYMTLGNYNEEETKAQP